jgi:hypothetical protein
VTCAGDRGAAALNACGGCSTLAIAPGGACGPCSDGTYTCSGANLVVCAGATPDSDGDTVCDNNDRCNGHDDRVDTDFDTVPNGCDRCQGSDDRLDADSDGTPNGCDRCAAGPDSADHDGDGVPNACDCNLAGCSASATCGETTDGPICTCSPGYTGNGFTCNPVDCGPLSNPTGGTVSLTGTTYLNTATTTCRSGWTLNGTATRTCEASGNWSTPGSWCTNPNQVWCACGGAYAAGDRVISVVSWVSFPNAAGQTIGLGRMGTVRGGGSTGYPLLVEWDNWYGGTGVCGGALQCGACTGTASSRYWVHCADVAIAP